jgi:hypothetical protein
MVAVTPWVTASITDTVPAPTLVTKTVPAAGSTATQNGPEPTRMVAVAARVGASITDTVPALLLAT